MQNSHVQLSQLLMRGFSYKTKEGDKVQYLDLNDNIIKEEKVNKLDAIPGYFDEEVEKQLAEIESKFGEVIFKFKKFQKKEIDFILSKDNLNTIQCFIDCLILRNEKIATISKKSSVILSSFDATPSDVLRWYDCEDNNYRILGNRKANVLVNKTDVDFVLPRNGLYMVRKNEKYEYVLPIAKKVAILMMDEKLYEEHRDGDILEYAYIDLDEGIKKFNDVAYYTEKDINNRFVIGSEEELKRLQKLGNR